MGKKIENIIGGTKLENAAWEKFSQTQIRHWELRLESTSERWQNVTHIHQQ